MYRFSDRWIAFKNGTSVRFDEILYGWEVIKVEGGKAIVRVFFNATVNGAPKLTLSLTVAVELKTRLVRDTSTGEVIAIWPFWLNPDEIGAESVRFSHIARQNVTLGLAPKRIKPRYATYAGEPEGRLAVYFLGAGEEAKGSLIYDWETGLLLSSSAIDDFLSGLLNISFIHSTPEGHRDWERLGIIGKISLLRTNVPVRLRAREQLEEGVGAGWHIQTIVATLIALSLYSTVGRRALRRALLERAK